MQPTIVITMSWHCNFSYTTIRISCVQDSKLGIEVIDSAYACVYI